MHYAPLTRYARRQWRGLVLIFALTLLSAAATTLGPLPIKLLVDHALEGEPMPAWLGDWGALSPARLIALAAGAVLAVYVVTTLLSSLLAWAWAVVGTRMVYALAGDLFARMQRLSLRFHTRSRVGDSLSRIYGDSWSVYTLVDSGLVNPSERIAAIAFVTIAAFKLDAPLAWVMLAVSPVLAASAFFFGRFLKARARDERRVASALTSFVHQTLSAIPIVQAFGTERFNRERFVELASSSVGVSKRGSVLRQSFSLVNGLAAAIGTAVILYAGGRRVLNGELGLGTLLVFLAYVQSTRGAWQVLLGAFVSFRTAQASAERVLEVLASPDEVVQKPGAKRLERVNGELRLEDVSFAYTPDRPVLDRVSVTIAPGETVALVGPTGSGKSTLASLVPRFVDPQSGVVCLDGQDLRDLDLASLREQISLMLQEPFLMPMSVAENIAYGKPGATREEVIRAAVAADADEFICQLPKGYDTILSERGQSLSGGQRQRLAIARALLKDAPILILDEPTSALDTRTEAAVMEAIWTRPAGPRTTLIIAHRLSTARRADRILVLDRGRLVQSGTHEELVSQDGLYRRLHEAQLASAEPAA